jgi:AcrR family transcriptional regulator
MKNTIPSKTSSSGKNKRAPSPAASFRAPAAQPRPSKGGSVGKRKTRGSAGTSYHHGNLRAALIKAGLQALKINERRDPSLRSLARRVGVSANASYRHFANKEALLAALATEGFRRLHAAELSGAEKFDRPELKFRGAGRAYVQFAIDNPGLFRLMFGRITSSQQDPELFKTAMASVQTMLDILAQMTGLKPEDPRLLLNFLSAWAGTHGTAHLVLSGLLDVFGDAGTLIDAIIYTDVPLWMSLSR